MFRGHTTIKRTALQAISQKTQDFLGDDCKIVIGHLGSSWQQEPIKTLYLFKIYKIEENDEQF